MYICLNMYATTLLLLSVSSSVYGLFLTPDSIVRQNTPVGEIFGRRGNIHFDGINKEMTIFRGIPYAEEPVRFEKPVPKAPFTSPFAATDFGPICPQPGTRLEDTSEDCLSLNIYIPTSSQSTATLPVMIWIHGGGYLYGSGSIYDFERFSAFGDVIVVTLNYRLAQLGFLSINSSYIPGNYGLWDQHLAIQWVHDNIGAFGGNASEVTIFGESAGSSSVMYQTLYPGNKGLFQRAIAESGSITSLWAKKNMLNAKKSAQNFAHACDCPSDDDELLVQCLRALPLSKLAHVMNESRFSALDNSWTVTVDQDFVVTNQSEMFDMSNVTADALSFFNDIELIIGINRADGLVYLPEVANMLNQTSVENFTLTRHQFENIIMPGFLRAYNDYTDVPDIAETIVHFAYTNWSHPHDDIARLRSFIQFLTDVVFTVPTLTALNARNANSAKSYFYELAFRPTYSYSQHITRVESESSANHADDLLFILDSVLKYQHTDAEQQLAYAMITMWSNFAKTGNPNQPEDVRQYYPVTWPPYDSQTQSYLEFSHQMSPQSVKQRLAADRMRMWLHLLPTIVQTTLVC